MIIYQPSQQNSQSPPHLSFSLPKTPIMSTAPPLSLSSLLLLFFATTSLLTTPSTSSTESFIYVGCSPLKYSPGSPYESNVSSILTSLVNAATLSTYNKFTSTCTGSSTPQDTVYGLFQCRGDLQNSDCAKCVSQSVSQLGVLCHDSCGGSLQLEGCFIRYDNNTFLGVEDKTVVMKKCGPLIGYDSDELTRRDAVLAFLAGGGQSFRVGNSGNVQGVAQCVGDLSASECQDCVSDAIEQLKTECGTASSGDMFLAKCYARYSDGGVHSHSGSGYYDDHKEDDDDDDDNNDIEKTLAILIGLIVAVALIIVFLSFIKKVLSDEKGCK